MSIIEGTGVEEALYRYKAKVSDDDTAPGYLSELIQSGDAAIEITVDNSGGDETLLITLDESELDVCDDEKVKVTSKSSTSKYLADALSGGSGISVSYDSGDDELDIALDASIADIQDVSGDSPSDGDVLIYNATTEEWTPTDMTLDDLSDVETDSPELYSVLVKNADGVFDNRYKLCLVYSSSMWAGYRKRILTESAMAAILQENYVEDSDGSPVMARTREFGYNRCSFFIWDTTLDVRTIGIEGIGAWPTPDINGSNKAHDAENTSAVGSSQIDSDGATLSIVSATPYGNMAVFTDILDQDFATDSELVISLMLGKTSNHSSSGDFTYVAVQLRPLDISTGEEGDVVNGYVYFEYDGSTSSQTLSVSFDAADYGLSAGKIMHVGVSVVDTDGPDAEVPEIKLIAARSAYGTKKYNLDASDI